MNCKPGDLAVIVSGEQRGVICRVLHGVDVSDFVRSFFDVSGQVWRVELLSRAQNVLDQTLAAGHRALIEDRRLRPIKPGDVSGEEVRDLYAPKLPETA